MCLPSALLLYLWALSPASLSPHSTTSHLGFSVPCTPDRDPLPPPAAFQISQSQTKSGEEWDLCPFLVSVFKSTEVVRVMGIEPGGVVVRVIERLLQLRPLPNLRPHLTPRSLCPAGMVLCGLHS